MTLQPAIGCTATLTETTNLSSLVPPSVALSDALSVKPSQILYLYGFLTMGLRFAIASTSASRSNMPPGLLTNAAPKIYTIKLLSWWRIQCYHLGMRDRLNIDVNGRSHLRPRELSTDYLVTAAEQNGVSSFDVNHPMSGRSFMRSVEPECCEGLRDRVRSIRSGSFEPNDVDLAPATQVVWLKQVVPLKMDWSGL